MKYQYILNGEILFQSDNISEYFAFLIQKEDKSVMFSVLYNLLDKSGGYICNMATAG